MEVKELYFPQLQQTVADLLLNLNDDQLRPLEKADFEQIVGYLRELLQHTPSMKDKVAEIMEKFCLDFALKCFKCSLLEKKMNGLMYIEEVLEQAQNRERMTYLHHPIHDEYSPVQYPQTFMRHSQWIDVK